MASAVQPCAPCQAQTKKTLHSRPHEGLRMIRERSIPGSTFGSARETEYSCGDCGSTVTHSTDVTECAWRLATAIKAKDTLARFRR